MEGQPPRLPWLRMATMARPQTDPQPARPARPAQPAQPAQPPPAIFARLPTLPAVRVPTVPPAAPQPRAPAPLPPQPTFQPVARPPPPLPPTAQPAQPRPVTPPLQQEVPKQAVSTSNGAVAPVTAPSPPPSPKVIKTSTPTPPPSPRVAPQVPSITTPNNKAAIPEPEIKPVPELARLKTIAMQEVEDKKGNGNGNGDSNTKPYKDINGDTNTNGKINSVSYNNTGNGKISNGGNGTNSNGMRGIPPSQQEREEIENGRGMLEAKAKSQHFNSGMAPPNSNHKKGEKDMKVITIAGENIGALMELGHNAHGYGRKMYQGGKNLTSGSGTQDGKATESMENKGAAHAKPMTSLVNSNVQSINNSLLFNSSCTQKSPGVHLTLKSKSKGKAHKPSLDSPSS